VRHELAETSCTGVVGSESICSYVPFSRSATSPRLDPTCTGS
jgi:hypothetical protein